MVILCITFFFFFLNSNFLKNTLNFEFLIYENDKLDAGEKMFLPKSYRI